jgi:uncharacterized protein (TIGR00725 family)
MPLSAWTGPGKDGVPIVSIDQDQGGSVRPGRRLYIGVVGSGAEDRRTNLMAEAVGRGIAHAGAIVVCGGLGGVMAAACRGARSEGGPTLGLLPGNDRAAGNAWLDLAVPTGLGEIRNALVVRAADALIAVGGEFGTLSEIALALKAGTPVVGLETWELARAGQPVDAVVRADTPDAAVTLAVELGRAFAGLV